jgi:hypothetical protein
MPLSSTFAEAAEMSRHAPFVLSALKIHVSSSEQDALKGTHDK